MLKDHLRDEVQVMNFLEVRLRPECESSSPPKLRPTTNTSFLPDLQKTGNAALSLDQVEPKIRELLTQQRMDELSNVWLHNLRQQAEIKSTVPIPAGNAPADESRASGSN